MILSGTTHTLKSSINSTNRNQPYVALTTRYPWPTTYFLHCEFDLESASICGAAVPALY